GAHRTHRRRARWAARSGPPRPRQADPGRSPAPRGARRAIHAVRGGGSRVDRAVPGEEALPAPGAGGVPSGTPKPVILVADDTPANLSVLLEVLGQAGLDVVIA